MAGKKRVLNITVDESLAADVRAEAEEYGTTISSVVEQALAEHLKWWQIRREGLAAMEEYFREYGEPTPEESAAALAEVMEAERLIDEARARNEERRKSGHARQVKGDAA
jgi:hypothetical protein